MFKLGSHPQDTSLHIYANIPKSEKTEILLVPGVSYKGHATCSGSLCFQYLDLFENSTFLKLCFICLFKIFSFYNTIIALFMCLEASHVLPYT